MDDVTDGQILGFIMVLVYLVVFSFGASKFNKRMHRVNQLKKLLRIDNVNKTKVNTEIAELTTKIQHYKGVIYCCFFALLIVHYMIPLMSTYSYFGFYWYGPLLMFCFFIGLILMFYSYEAKTVIPGKAMDGPGMGGYF